MTVYSNWEPKQGFAALYISDNKIAYIDQSPAGFYLRTANVKRFYPSLDIAIQQGCKFLNTPPPQRRKVACLPEFSPEVQRLIHYCYQNKDAAQYVFPVLEKMAEPRLAKKIPAKVKEYAKDIEKKNPSYDQAKVWATAWSIYCRYKNPDSEHCKQEKYFKNRKASWNQVVNALWGSE